MIGAASSSVPGFFPLDANPAAHMLRVPFACTVGLVWEGGEGGTARVRLPLGPAAATSDGSRVDPLAILALLDHSCSAAVYLALPRPRLIATIDLRCEFACAVEPGSDVLCMATAQFLDDAVAIVRATAIDARNGRCVAYASSAYAIGSHPGMTGRKVDPQAWLQTAAASGPGTDFRDMLDLQSSGESTYVLPFERRLVGAVTLPAVHGGASAAAATLAAIAHARKAMEPHVDWRPLSVTVHYLRPVQATALTLTPALRKPGSRICEIGVTSFQQSPDKECVHAECLLVADH